MALKSCKDCGKEISSSVNKCPSCGKDQRNFFAKHKILTAILVIIVLGSIGSLAGGDEKATTSTDPATPATTATTTAPATTTTTTPAPAPEPVPPKAPPMVVTVDKLMTDLEGNALNASNTYKGKYVEVTGQLSVIDSGGKYFSIIPMNKQFAIIGVQCSITEEQKASVAKFTKDQKVTVIGTISNVGEIMGYSLKVESIK